MKHLITLLCIIYAICAINCATVNKVQDTLSENRDAIVAARAAARAFKPLAEELAERFCEQIKDKKEREFCFDNLRVLQRAIDTLLEMSEVVVA